MMSDLLVQPLKNTLGPFLCPFLLNLIMSVEITIVLVLKQIAHSLCVFPFNIEFKAVF